MKVPRAARHASLFFVIALALERVDETFPNFTNTKAVVSVRLVAREQVG